MTPLRSPTRSLIEAARPAERPTVADRDRVRARVMSKIATAGAAAAIATATTKAAGNAAAGTAAAGAGTLGTAAAATGTTAGIVKAVVIGTLAGVCALGASQVTPKAPPEAPRVTASAVVTSAPVARPEPPKVVEAAPKPVASTPEPPEQRVARPEPKPSGSAGMRGEIEVLKEAQRAIAAGQTDRAMALLDEHAQRWKGGALAEERLAARAIALCEAGRGDEARRAAARFLAEAKSSPLEPSVRAACAAVLSAKGRETP